VLDELKKIRFYEEAVHEEQRRQLENFNQSMAEVTTLLSSLIFVVALVLQLCIVGEVK
jgi:hypothetical protein